MSKAKSHDAQSQKSCFVIMPISDVDGYPAGHFEEVYNQLIAPAVEAAGYACELATTTKSAHMIQLEVVTKVVASDLCICDLSTNNPNVMFEYGIRQAFDKPTVLIKDDRTRRIFDLTGFRDIEYDHSLRISNTLKTRIEIMHAVEDTVNGSSDHSQIFSLVKLMNLAKATLPSGEIKPEEARFELLDKKLNAVIELIASERKAKEANQRVVDALLNRPKIEENSLSFFGKAYESFPDNKNRNMLLDGLLKQDSPLDKS